MFMIIIGKTLPDILNSTVCWHLQMLLRLSKDTACTYFLSSSRCWYQLPY